GTRLFERKPEHGVEEDEDQDGGDGAAVGRRVARDEPGRKSDHRGGEDKSDQLWRERDEPVEAGADRREHAPMKQRGNRGGDADADEEERHRPAPAISGRLAKTGEIARAGMHIDGEAGDHADGRRAEAPMPADLLAEIAADERPERGADV